MPAVFVPPIALNNPSVGPEHRGIAYRLFRYLGPQPVGRSVLGIPDAQGNLLTAAQMSMETGIGGWLPSFECTLSWSLAQAAEGTHSLAMTSTNPNGTSSAMTTNVAISPSTQYTALLSLWAPAAGKLATLSLRWFAADGALISANNSTADNAAGWTNHVVTATSPATARYAALVAQFQNTSAGQVYYVDKASLRAGASTTWTPILLVYSTVDRPDQMILATATEVYLGGHEYVVSDAVAAALFAGGYSVSDLLLSSEGGDALITEGGDALELEGA